GRPDARRISPATDRRKFYFRSVCLTGKLTGRFLSVDPVTAYSDPVGQFNRYRYANNNPFRFIDPDGRLSSDETEKNEQPLTDLATVVVTGQKLPTTPPTKTFPAVRVVGRPMPAPTPWGPLVAEWTISLGARIV